MDSAPAGHRADGRGTQVCERDSQTCVLASGCRKRNGSKRTSVICTLANKMHTRRISDLLRTQYKQDLHLRRSPRMRYAECKIATAILKVSRQWKEQEMHHDATVAIHTCTLQPSPNDTLSYTSFTHPAGTTPRPPLLSTSHHPSP